jgi:hypothetical protein
MTKRGRVLRDTTSGPGLLMMEGQQYRFSLEGVWKSETPPKPGLVVDVELGARGKVQGITVVPDSQLAREQAEAAMALTRQKARNLASSLVARSVMPSLAAAGLLSAAWFFPTAASIQVPFPGKLEFTFWQILAFLNAGNVPELLDGNRSSGAGVYGFVAIVALLGPFIHHFWKDKRALLGGLLPLAFMVVVGIALRTNIHSALGSGNAGSNADVGKQTHEAMKAVSLGLGSYLSILASLYFAFTSAKGYRVATATEGEGLDAPQRKAA